MYKNQHQYNFLKTITHKYQYTIIPSPIHPPLFNDKHPWAYKILPPFPHPYINYNQSLNDIPKPKGKFYWEKDCRPLKLLPAVMGATLLLGGPVKIIDGKIPIKTFGVRKLQIVSE